MLADTILVIHFAFVLFVVLGFALILIGGLAGWAWVRNRPFRMLHLVAIALVAAESLAGIACPLTVWENALRHADGGGPSFIGRWVTRLLYYDAPEQVFTVLYVTFALMVAATMKWIPPRRRGDRHGSSMGNRL
jgi:hypothetical protein